MSEVELTSIRDEDLLRRMWQQTDDFGRKKDIRAHMYKLREERLRNFYTGDMDAGIGITKSPMTSSHGDSLTDQSFQSFKAKEIRDSESPTRAYNAITAPTSSEWNVVSSSEVTPDGKTHTAHSLATTDSNQVIPGGKQSFSGKNEQLTSDTFDGDDKNFKASSGHVSNTVLKEHVVKGDPNNGRFESKTSNTTSSSSSTFVSKQFHSDGNADGTPFIKTIDIDQNNENSKFTNAKDISSNYAATTTHTNTNSNSNNNNATNNNNNIKIERQNYDNDEQNRMQSSKMHQQHEKYHTEFRDDNNIQMKDTSSASSADSRTFHRENDIQSAINTNTTGQLMSRKIDYPDANTKVITETKSLPDGSIMTTTKYETRSSGAKNWSSSSSSSFNKQSSSSVNSQQFINNENRSNYITRGGNDTVSNKRIDDDRQSSTKNRNSDNDEKYHHQNVNSSTITRTVHDHNNTADQERKFLEQENIKRDMEHHEKLRRMEFSTGNNNNNNVMDNKSTSSTTTTTTKNVQNEFSNIDQQKQFDRATHRENIEHQHELNKQYVHDIRKTHDDVTDRRSVTAHDNINNNNNNVNVKHHNIHVIEKTYQIDDQNQNRNNTKYEQNRRDTENIERIHNDRKINQQFTNEQIDLTNKSERIDETRKNMKITSPETTTKTTTTHQQYIPDYYEPQNEMYQEETHRTVKKDLSRNSADVKNVYGNERKQPTDRVIEIPVEYIHTKDDHLNESTRSHTKTNNESKLNETRVSTESFQKSDYQSKRISVDHNPTHEAFARSLRCISPVDSQRSLRSSNKSLPRSRTGSDRGRRSPSRDTIYSNSSKISTSTVTKNHRTNNDNTTKDYRRPTVSSPQDNKGPTRTSPTRSPHSSNQRTTHMPATKTISSETIDITKNTRDDYKRSSTTEKPLRNVDQQHPSNTPESNKFKPSSSATSPTRQSPSNRYSPEKSAEFPQRASNNYSTYDRTTTKRNEINTDTIDRKSPAKLPYTPETTHPNDEKNRFSENITISYTSRANEPNQPRKPSLVERNEPNYKRESPESPRRRENQPEQTDSAQTTDGKFHGSILIDITPQKNVDNQPNYMKQTEASKMLTNRTDVTTTAEDASHFRDTLRKSTHEDTKKITTKFDTDKIYSEYPSVLSDTNIQNLDVVTHASTLRKPRDETPSYMRETESSKRLTGRSRTTSEDESPAEVPYTTGRHRSSPERKPSTDEPSYMRETESSKRLTGRSQTTSDDESTHYYDTVRRNNVNRQNVTTHEVPRYTSPDRKPSTDVPSYTKQTEASKRFTERTHQTTSDNETNIYQNITTSRGRTPIDEPIDENKQIPSDGQRYSKPARDQPSYMKETESSKRLTGRSQTTSEDESTHYYDTVKRNNVTHEKITHEIPVNRHTSPDRKPSTDVPSYMKQTESSKRFTETMRNTTEDENNVFHNVSSQTKTTNIDDHFPNEKYSNSPSPKPNRDEPSYMKDTESSKRLLNRALQKDVVTTSEDESNFYCKQTTEAIERDLPYRKHSKSPSRSPDRTTTNKQNNIENRHIDRLNTYTEDINIVIKPIDNKPKNKIELEPNYRKPIGSTTRHSIPKNELDQPGNKIPTKSTSPIRSSPHQPSSPTRKTSERITSNKRTTKTNKFITQKNVLSDEEEDVEDEYEELERDSQRSTSPTSTVSDLEYLNVTDYNKKNKSNTSTTKTTRTTTTTNVDEDIGIPNSRKPNDTDMFYEQERNATARQMESMKKPFYLNESNRPKSDDHPDAPTTKDNDVGITGDQRPIYKRSETYEDRCRKILGMNSETTIEDEVIQIIDDKPNDGDSERPRQPSPRQTSPRQTSPQRTKVSPQRDVMPKQSSPVREKPIYEPKKEIENISVQQKTDTTSKIIDNKNTRKLSDTTKVNSSVVTTKTNRPSSSKSPSRSPSRLSDIIITENVTKKTDEFLSELTVNKKANTKQNIQDITIELIQSEKQQPNISKSRSPSKSPDRKPVDNFIVNKELSPKSQTPKVVPKITTSTVVTKPSVEKIPESKIIKKQPSDLSSPSKSKPSATTTTTTTIEIVTTDNRIPKSDSVPSKGPKLRAPNQHSPVSTKPNLNDTQSKPSKTIHTETKTIKIERPDAKVPVKQSPTKYISSPQHKTPGVVNRSTTANEVKKVTNAQKEQQRYERTKFDKTTKKTSELYSDNESDLESDEDDTPTVIEKTIINRITNNRKIPITERKDSAPVYRTTKVDKDAKMTRSTSDAIIKTNKVQSTMSSSTTSTSTTTTPNITRKPLKPEFEGTRAVPSKVPTKISTSRTTTDSPSKNRPTKCITTKTINLTTSATTNNNRPTIADLHNAINSEDIENIIIDIQQAKSSREPSPNRIIPIPVSPDEDTGKPRYPDTVHEPDDDTLRRKPKIQNIPIYEEETNEFVGCQISEVNENESFIATEQKHSRTKTTSSNSNSTTTKSTHLSDINKVTDIDECLLSVSDKVTKFSNQPQGKQPNENRNRSIERPNLDDIDEQLKTDECLLSVHDKVSKFITTAEEIKKPKTSAQLKLNDQNPLEQSYNSTIDDDLMEDECLLSVSDKVSKFITTAEKLTASAPQKSPELVAKIERQVSRKDKEDDTEDNFVTIDETEREIIKKTERKTNAVTDRYVKQQEPSPRNVSPKSPANVTRTESVQKAKAVFETNKTPKSVITTTTGVPPKNILLRPSIWEEKRQRDVVTKKDVKLTDIGVYTQNDDDDDDVEIIEEQIERKESVVPQYQTPKSTTSLRKETVTNKRNIFEKISTTNNENDGKIGRKSPQYNNRDHHPINKETKTTTTTITTAVKKPTDANKKPIDIKPEPKTTINNRKTSQDSEQIVSTKRSVYERMPSEKREPSRSTSPIPQDQKPHTTSTQKPSYMNHTVASTEHFRRDSIEVNKNHLKKSIHEIDVDDVIDDADGDTEMVDEEDVERLVNGMNTEESPRTPGVKFGVELKRTNSQYSQGRRKSSTSSDLPHIEEICDLLLLEKMLETVVGYEQRRRIRSQIRLVKKNLQDEIVSKKAYITTDDSEDDVKIKRGKVTQHFGVPSKKSPLRDTSTPNRQTNMKPITNIEDLIIPNVPVSNAQIPSVTGESEYTSSYTTKRIPKNVDGPIDDIDNNHRTGRTSNTKSSNTTTSSTTTKDYQRTSRSPSPKIQLTKTGRQTGDTEYNSSYTTKNVKRNNEEINEYEEEVFTRKVPIENETVTTTKTILRTSNRSPSPKTIGKQSTSVTTTTTRVKEQQTGTKPITTTTTTTKRTTLNNDKDSPNDNKPIWATKNILKKASETQNRTFKMSSTAKKTYEKSDKLKTMNDRSEDCVTSSYGIGPTDDDGKPLFGIKALKKAKTMQSQQQQQQQSPSVDTTKVTGVIIKESMYSENGAEPIGKRTVTHYSSDPNDVQEQTNTSEITIDEFNRNSSRNSFNRKGINQISSTHTDINYDNDVEDRFIREGSMSKHSTRVVRRGSVKELSEKFLQNESQMEESNKPNNQFGSTITKTTTTTTNRAADLFPKVGAGYTLKTQTQTSRSTTPVSTSFRSDSVDFDECDVEIRKPQQVGSTHKRTVIETVGKNNTTGGVGNKTMTTTTTTTSSSSSSGMNKGRQDQVRSFTNSKSKVTGVQDCLNRMSNADNVEVMGDTQEDREARALLNKFLGASVLMSGVETMIPTEINHMTGGSQTTKQKVTTKIQRNFK